MSKVSQHGCFSGGLRPGNYMLMDSNGHTFSKKSQAYSMPASPYNSNMQPRLYIDGTARPAVFERDRPTQHAQQHHRNHQSSFNHNRHVASNPPACLDDEECSYIPEEDVINLTSSDDTTTTSQSTTSSSTSSIPQIKRKKHGKKGKRNKSKDHKKKAEQKDKRAPAATTTTTAVTSVAKRDHSKKRRGGKDSSSSHDRDVSNSNSSSSNKASRLHIVAKNTTDSKPKSKSLKCITMVPIANSGSSSASGRVSFDMPRTRGAPAHANTTSSNTSTSHSHGGGGDNNNNVSNNANNGDDVIEKIDAFSATPAFAHKKSIDYGEGEEGEDGFSNSNSRHGKERKEACETVRAALAEIERCTRVIEEKRALVLRLCLKYDINPADISGTKTSNASAEEHFPTFMTPPPKTMHLGHLRAKKFEPGLAAVGQFSKRPHRPKSTMYHNPEPYLLSPLCNTLTTSSSPPSSLSSSSSSSSSSSLPQHSFSVEKKGKDGKHDSHKSRMNRKDETVKKRRKSRKVEKDSANGKNENSEIKKEAKGMLKNNSSTPKLSSCDDIFGGVNGSPKRRTDDVASPVCSPGLWVSTGGSVQQQQQQQEQQTTIKNESRFSLAELQSTPLEPEKLDGKKEKRMPHFREKAKKK